MINNRWRHSAAGMTEVNEIRVAIKHMQARCHIIIFSSVAYDPRMTKIRSITKYYY